MLATLATAAECYGDCQSFAAGLVFLVPILLLVILPLVVVRRMDRD